MKFRFFTKLALAFCFAGFFVSRAAAFDMVSPSIETVASTSTIATIQIASHTTTDVVQSTAPLYRQVCVQNVTANGSIVCGDNVNLSTQTSSANFGVALTSSSAISLPYCFQIVAGNKFYCSTTADNAVSRAAIWRKR